MGAKLLLADDSVTIQRVIELTFADEDVEVVAVGDGQQAIDHLQHDRPDIVLADVGMPARDGYEVASFIKNDPSLAHIPVLLLTGAFEPIDEVRARAVGCDGVLVKPFEPQMVISRVRELLAGTRHSDTLLGHHEMFNSHTPSHGAGNEQKGEPASEDAAGGTSLEDYFDRLDAALANKASSVPAGPPPPTRAVSPLRSVPFPQAVQPRPVPVAPPPVPEPPSTGTLSDLSRADLDFGSWDPTAPDEPVSPEPMTFDADPGPAARDISLPTPAPIGPPAVVPHESSPEPTIARAAPEETWEPPSLQDAFNALLAAEQVHSAPPPARGVESLSNEAIDEIVRRVIARMGDDTMRALVLDAAERLVKEEITRIKAQK